MAIVNVDLSEYDMLRKAKNVAEEEIKVLKEEIKGLKDRSRVILETKDVEITQEGKDSLYYYFENYFCVRSKDISPIINKIITIINGNRVSHASTQYIGFNDVEYKVKADLEERYKKKLEASIESYDQSKERYNEQVLNVRKEIEEVYNEKLKKYEEELKSKEDKIKELSNKISELSKSRDEKISELTNNIKEAENKLLELNYKRVNMLKSVPVVCICVAVWLGIIAISLPLLSVASTVQNVIGLVLLIIVFITIYYYIKFSK